MLSKDDWIVDAKNKVRILKNSHYLQRVQMELAFETTPRDSRYSNALLDLMKKEENILKDINSHGSSAASIVQKVDEVLRAETQAFFAKSSQQNIKRLIVLGEKFAKERSQLQNSLLHLNSTSNNLAQSKANHKTGNGGGVDLYAEAERLEADYNRQWFMYENYNLQQAFNSQSARVENDWLSHEVALSEEYKTRKESILGCLSDTVASVQTNPQHEQRWQHPEKQKTLIHTAPVLTPTRREHSAGMTESGDKWTKGKKEMELEKLNREYQLSIGSLEKQKADAKRWLLRQQVRLQAQAEQVRHEKATVADLLEAAMRDFQTISNLT